MRVRKRPRRPKSRMEGKSQTRHPDQFHWESMMWTQPPAQHPAMAPTGKKSMEAARPILSEASSGNTCGAWRFAIQQVTLAIVL
mmetsp:Transcript_20205/g.43308  ORF Transcript_20205/g.43308 Transcript_20205/m.43308 type:complete len:84 (-) Transcript_20205:61-312(-)